MDHGPRGKYCTLSYRWTTSSLLVTTTANLELHKSRISLSDLPPTLRDAIIVTRKLGVRYLWIDALCIIQDSPEDWQEQASQMHEVYRNAWVNISADIPLSGAKGFLSPRDKYAISPCYHPRAGKLVHPVVPEAFQIIDMSHLSERGWILQERYFSPRIIHWGALEVSWECNEMEASERQKRGHQPRAWRSQILKQKNLESEQSALPLRVLGTGLNIPEERENPYTNWYRLLEQYSGRFLTYPDKDKLKAISSIAREFLKRNQAHVNSESDYISGLWKGDIAYGLLLDSVAGQSWRSSNGLEPIPECNLQDPTSWQFRKPSFSWTAFDAPVEWVGKRLNQRFLREYDAELVHAKVQLASDDSSGAVTLAELTIRTVMIGPEEWENRSRITNLFIDTPGHGSIPPETRALRLKVAEDASADLGKISYWLLIFPVASRPNVFRRIGSLCLWNFIAESIEPVEITLI